MAGIPSVPTLAGFVSLAIVLDMFSRRIVDGSIAGHLHTELVLDALDRAVQQRRPDSIVHQCDREELPGSCMKPKPLTVH